MTQTALTHKIEELQELEGMVKELSEEIEAIKDILKDEMNEQGIEEMFVGDYIVRYTSVLTSKFNSKEFKEDHLDLYKAYLKQVSSKRFSISY